MNEKCSKCNSPRQKNHYYCKPCRAEYQRERRKENKIDSEIKPRCQSHISDNYNGWF